MRRFVHIGVRLLGFPQVVCVCVCVFVCLCVCVFDLGENNRCRAVGTVWVRQGCIPMGGPFSAQAADLHSLWRVYRHRHLFCRLGSLIVSDAGFPNWVGRHTVAMVQFRDNKLVAMDPPPPATSLQTW